MKSVVFYANAGASVGLGHFKRSTALAHAFQKVGIDVQLWSPEIQIQSSIKQKLCKDIQNFKELLKAQKETTDLFFFDSYQEDLEDWIQLVANRAYALDDAFEKIKLPVMGILHLGPRQPEELPDALAKKSFFGLHYYPLQEDWKSQKRKRIQNEVQKIGITMGGSDPKNQTEEVYSALSKLYSDSQSIPACRIFYGPLSKGPSKELKTQSSLEIYHSDPNYIPLISECDFVISSAGVSAFELASIGMPLILIPLSFDQVSVCKIFEKNDAGLILPIEKIKSDLKVLIDEILKLEKRNHLHTQALQLIDGQGAERFANDFKERSAYLFSAARFS